MTRIEWIEHCLALIDSPVQPLSDGERREFDRSCNQATADAEWRIHNPPQTDLFHRG